MIAGAPQAGGGPSSDDPNDAWRLNHVIVKTLIPLVAPLLVVTAHRMPAQQLGFKLLGSAGIDAGVQVLPGLTVVAQAIHYGATQLRDRHGNVAPVEGVSI